MKTYRKIRCEFLQLALDFEEKVLDAADYPVNFSWRDSLRESILDHIDLIKEVINEPSEDEK